MMRDDLKLTLMAAEVLISIEGVGIKQRTHKAAGTANYQDSFKRTPITENGEELPNLVCASLTNCF